MNDEQIHEMIEYRLYDILSKFTEYCNESFEEKVAELEKNKETFDRNKLLEDTFFEIIDGISQIKEELLPEFTEYKFEEFKLEFKKTYKILFIYKLWAMLPDINPKI